MTNVQTQTTKAPSKMQLASAIYLSLLEAKTPSSRSEVQARFVKEAGCTPSGAGTYFQTLRDKHGALVAPVKPEKVKPEVKAEKPKTEAKTKVESKPKATTTSKPKATEAEQVAA